MEEYSYQTIEQPIEDTLLKEKGSKFLGFAYPVATEDEVKEALNKVKSEHPKATHHCYAFRLGLDGENYRANDDGEPSGSAGLPIYNQLLSHHLTNILLVVVRYYGGVKLGVGGLVKTYKESAKLTLEQAKVITKELENDIVVDFPFHLQNVIFTHLNKYEAQILDFSAAENCQIRAKVKKVKQEALLEQLSNIHQVRYVVK